MPLSQEKMFQMITHIHCVSKLTYESLKKWMQSTKVNIVERSLLEACTSIICASLAFVKKSLEIC